jgi:hypothetical protein
MDLVKIQGMFLVRPTHFLGVELMNSWTGRERKEYVITPNRRIRQGKRLGRPIHSKRYVYLPS